MHMSNSLAHCKKDHSSGGGGGGRDVSELAETDFRFCYHVEPFDILFACNGKGALHRSGCGIYASLLLTGLLRLFGTA